MSDFYSYLQEKDDEDVIAYSFVSDNGSLYYVYFDPYQYDKYTNTYPNLLGNGFGFGFYRAYKAGRIWEEDAKIGLTISKIVSDFIDEYGINVVLLYHCYHVDGKQKGRDKIFNDWYQDSIIKDTIIKQRVKIDQILESGGESELFMGYLTSSDNPIKDNVSDEFFTFVENLTSYKP